MNKGNSAQVEMSLSAARESRSIAASDEISQRMRELLHAEVRLAKARATMVTAEIDIKALSARLRALTK